MHDIKINTVTSSKTLVKVKKVSITGGGAPQNNKIKIMGVNVNGIVSKLPSFKAMIHAIKPDVFILQETKLVVEGSLKIEGYVIFEKVRTLKGGGGLVIGVKPKLAPIWVNEGEDDETETLSVVIKTKTKNIRVCSGYGPQNNAPEEAKDKFWEYVSNDLAEAMKNKEEYLIEMDANSYLGPNLLPKDPRKQNINGKKMEEFLNDNGNVVLLNASNKCEGTITRE